MSDTSDTESSHDAEVVVRDTRKGRIIGWQWEDDRMTLSPIEHAEMSKVIKKAENRQDPEEYDENASIARVWVTNETVREVEWLE